MTVAPPEGNHYPIAMEMKLLLLLLLYLSIPFTLLLIIISKLDHFENAIVYYNEFVPK